MTVPCRIERKLSEGARSAIFVGRAEDRSVIVKSLKDPFPSTQERAALEREHDLLVRLAATGLRTIVPPIALQEVEGRAAIVMEDVGGVGLDSLIASGSLSVLQRLQMAQAVTRALGDVHSQGVVHKDIKPSNVLVSEDGSRAWIIDFGISSELGSEEHRPSGHIQGTLPYMSPEQTGRMNRPVDYRSDFYSLGCSLYALFGGHPPFEGRDPMAMVHAHLARTPAPVHELDPRVPPSVSAVIDRLLQKLAEDRYQTARGIASDLARCAERFANGVVDPFPLATDDRSDRFQVPRRLYGRTHEVSVLLRAFESAAGGQARMLLVSGWSGVGKSALVAEIHKPIVRRHGYFLRGKFDQYRRNVPYSALIQALGALVSQIVTEPEERVARWTERLRASLGDMAAVVASFLPSIEVLLGPQPAPPELTGDAVRHRFQQAFVDFVSVFARSESPVVLFLDDLQWADQPSLDLLRLLLTNDSVQNLLVLGAFRDNEVGPSHPLSVLRGELKEAAEAGDARPEGTVHLEGLTIGDLQRLLGDALSVPPDDTAALAELVHGKTLGNPFFVNEFLEDLHKRGLITFDPTGHWRWDLPAIRTTKLTENVVELVTARLDELPALTREALRMAAALGNVFGLGTLTAVTGRSKPGLAETLWPALQQGLLVPLDDTYRLVGHVESDDLDPRYAFQHDRVQQAAYLLTPEDERAATHLHIGRSLRAAGAEEEDLFAVVDQLGHGLDLVTDPAERLSLAELFGDAGARARQSNAVAPSIDYLRAAIGLLGDAPWEQHYELQRSFANQLAESLYLAGDIAPAEALIDELLERSRTNLERVRVHRMRIDVQTTQGAYVEAVDGAIAALKLCGVQLPRRPGLPGMLLELSRLKLALLGKPLSSLPDLDAATDDLKIEAMRILAGIAAPGTFISIELGSTIILRMCRLSVKHGNCGASAFGWALYGMITGPILGDFGSARELLLASQDISERYLDISIRSKLRGAQGAMIAPWVCPHAEALRYLEDSYKSGLESGDPTHSHYASCQILYVRVLIGDKLDLVEELTTQYLDYGRRNRMSESPETLTIERQMARVLRGRSRSTRDWSDDDFDEGAWVEMVGGFSMRLPLHLYACVKAQVSYVFGHHDLALQMVALSKTEEDAAAGLPYRALQNLYEVLALCALWDTRDAAWRREARKHLKANMKKVRLWAQHSPSTFEHKRLMLEAEVARIDGAEDEATRLIDEALALLRDHTPFHQDRGIANEIAARLHRRAGRDRVAEVYLRAAREAYATWGATEKVRELEAAHPHIAVIARRSTTETSTRIETSTTDSHASLDLQTVIRATEAISGEIVFDRLLERLLTLTVENAGARRAVLVLEGQRTPVVAAERKADGSMSVGLNEPLERREDLSAAVIRSVRRTTRPIIVDDASAPGRFASCPWLGGGNTRTALAVPLLRSGTLTGVLYLENDLATGVFTPERLELLGLLSSQMAIAIENARLYADLEGLADAYSRFVPREFLQFLGTPDIRQVRLGDAVEREMTVLFSDIRDFTSLSERLSPEENFRFLNEYLGRVGPVIREHGGFIDKYIGDAVMALFPDGPGDAIAAAISMQRAADHLNEERPEGEQVRIGVGIHHGRLMLGTIGEERRLDGTVISDAVNIASRLEGLTKTFGASVLVSGATLRHLDPESRLKRRYLGQVRPRGRTEAVEVHEIYEGDPAERVQRLDRHRPKLESAMEALFGGDMPEAWRLLMQLRREDPEDPVPGYYLDRIEVAGATGQHAAVLDETDSLPIAD